MKTPPYKNLLTKIGPGIAIAATGIGAGDMVAAAVAGSRYGFAVLWVALFGALLKFSLNEGIARWQLATGTTLIEGWSNHLGKWISWLFAAYLVLWSFIVAGAMMSACGLAAHAIFPQLSVAAWGAIHSLIALTLVLLGGYSLFENLVKVIIAAMFLLVLTCAVWIQPDPHALISGLVIPKIPAGSGPFLLGIIGGVGGSVTVLNYSYWIQEKGWRDASFTSMMRLDLGVAYILTGLFGVAIMLLAAGVKPEAIQGSAMVLALAERLGDLFPTAKSLFLWGFWAAVFTSMLGVWQGIPYLFADFLRVQGPTPEQKLSTRLPSYRSFLIFLAIPPMLLLLYDRPVFIIILYAITGALFMPFLAATLLYMNNNSDWVNSLKNGWKMNIALALALLVMLSLFIRQIFIQISKLG
ncbi:MAG: Nramp family divalent metal transporter [Calditrichia bacterium]